MIIRNNTILSEYARISGTWEFSSCIPSIRIVEDKFIIPIIGDDLYTVLNQALDAATDSDPLDPVWVELTDYCRRAIGPLFCWFHADKADVVFTEGGMKRSESTQFKNAYQEQRNKFKEANLVEGEIALELLLQFLEKNQEDYPEWQDSPNFSKYKELFIKSGSEFNELFPSQTPFRNYWAIRPSMYDVEQISIQAFLGKELFTTLKTEDQKKNPDFSDEEKILLQMLRKAIANLTVASAIAMLNVRLGKNGITTPASATFSQDDVENTRAGLPDKWVDTYTKSCTDTGTGWLTQAESYIRDNKTVFADWIGFQTVTVTECNNNEGLESTFSF